MIDEKSESISDILYTSAHGNDYIGFLIYDDEGPRLVWRTFSETAVSSIDTIRLHRDGVELQGYLCHTNNKDEAVLFTLCRFRYRIAPMSINLRQLMLFFRVRW